MHKDDVDVYQRWLTTCTNNQFQIDHSIRWP